MSKEQPPGTSQQTPAEDARRPRVVFYSFLVLLAFILFLAFLVFRHFLITVGVSMSIAALLGPVYDRLTRALGGRRSLSAGLMVALTTVVILVPLLSYAVLLGNQALGFYDWVRPRLEPDALRQLWSEALPARYAWFAGLKEYFQLSQLDQARWMEIISPALSQMATGANRLIQGAVAGLTSALLDLVLFLITLFFVLRDGRTLAAELRSVAPFSMDQANEIYDRLTRTVKGVLYSMVVVPVAQGLLAMAGFAIFGLPSPLFWGTMLIFAAVIPGIGSPLVWVPATVYLFFAGSLWQGIGMLLYGTLIISTSDNIIKPILLREAANIHPLLAFFSILGGILSFGVIGFLIGPIILSLMLSAIRIYRMDVLRAPAGSSLAPSTSTPSK
jgi:predicted PurR-regulated permease PerM